MKIPRLGRGVALFAVAAMLVSGFVTSNGAAATAQSRVTEIGIENWSDVPEVSGELSWSKSSIANAKRVIRALEKNLSAQIEAVKVAGAVSIRVEKRNPDSDAFWLSATGQRWKMTRYVGLDSNSKIVASTNWDPANGVFFARHLVHLSSTNCSLRDFDLWDATTWFAQRCAVVSTSPEWLLRLSLEEVLAQGPKDLPKIIAYDLQRLDYALSNQLSCKALANVLTCKNLGRLTNNPGSDAISLGSDTGGWDYKISVDLAKRSATIRYLKPRPKLFAQQFDWRLSDYLTSSANATELVYPQK